MLSVVDNEIRYTQDAWDIEIVGKSIVLRGRGLDVSNQGEHRSRLSSVAVHQSGVPAR